MALVAIRLVSPPREEARAAAGSPSRYTACAVTRRCTPSTSVQRSTASVVCCSPAAHPAPPKMRPATCVPIQRYSVRSGRLSATAVRPSAVIVSHIIILSFTARVSVCS
eukprot:3164865-Prymnesium_polylepis.2